MRMPFLTGALIGLLVGGVVALLLAPARGAKTREEFRDRLHESVEAGRKRADEEAVRLEAHYHEMVDIAGQKQA